MKDGKNRWTGLWVGTMESVECKEIRREEVKGKVEREKEKERGMLRQKKP